jgi:predicted nuclease of predicted toxin-antitoxin system
MRIKLDENLPAGVGKTLAGMGHTVDTVPDEGLGGADDAAVWEAAQREAAFFVTQDLDFSDSARFRPGTHYGLLIVRLADPSRRALSGLLERIFATESVSEWSGCFVVASERKVRVRGPE